MNPVWHQHLSLIMAQWWKPKTSWWPTVNWLDYEPVYWCIYELLCLNELLRDHGYRISLNMFYVYITFFYSDNDIHKLDYTQFFYWGYLKETDLRPGKVLTHDVISLYNETICAYYLTVLPCIPLQTAREQNHQFITFWYCWYNVIRNTTLKFSVMDK